MILATMIAAVGIVTDSIILIIGAMIVGPEFRSRPLRARPAPAGPGEAVARRARRRFPVAIAATFVTVALRAAGLSPRLDPPPLRDSLHLRAEPVLGPRGAAGGVAGMVSLTTAKWAR